MARARVAGSQRARPIGGTWAIAVAPPGHARHPADLRALALEWIPCQAPIPVAAALGAAGLWDPERPRDLDAEEWWYRCRFEHDAATPSRLCFEGLATVADVWLNGTHILRSTSMFVSHVVGVAGLLRADNELMLCFHPLAPLLAAQRPRPTWRTALVAHQQLRWHRTSLLGRMPAWCPAVPPVGPWRPILIEPDAPIRIERAEVVASLDGEAGTVSLAVVASHASDVTIGGTFAIGDRTAAVHCEAQRRNELTLRASLTLPHVERWWPHTHGDQPLYDARLSLDVAGRPLEIDLGRVAFRDLRIDRDADGEGFGFVLNALPIFCRGVCWTPLDLARLDAAPAACRAALQNLRAAGMNMVRVGGTFVYETDAFYDLCDELGMLVWQDLMFASLDYPSGDADFEREAAIEARQILERLQARPSLALVCGNSEVQQQAAMLGLPPARWRHPLFDETIPRLVASLAPGVEYLPSTPHGGSLPFHVNRGVSHYYGIGAYRRPLEDARAAGVRFAAECLGFSNVPDPGLIPFGRTDGDAARDPRWKAGVPRDAGTDWDFEDVRDHYVGRLFGVDASLVRETDPSRYLALGRVAIGEVMLRTFAEWRRQGSTCRGGLVWFARDLRPGAGWGILDSSGRPKSVYWYLKRALAPVALLAIDEGLNGLWLHAVNDTADAIDADIRVSLYGGGRLRGRPAQTAIAIPARSVRSVHADALFDGFLDLTYAYRFGPPGHDAIAATMTDRTSGAMLATAHGFPSGLPAAADDDLDVTVRVEPAVEGFGLDLEANRFAHAVAIDAEGFVPDDNYLHLEPGRPRRVVLRGDARGLPLRGTVRALNGPAPVAIGFETGIGRH